MFDSLGITDTTLAVYRALLEHPEVNPAKIGSVLDLPAAAVDEQLELLRKHELLVVRAWSDTSGEEYAIHPNRGFNLLAEQRREELEHLQKDLRQDELAAQEITEQYNHMLRERTANETEILVGQERANQRMQQFMPTISMWGLVPGKFEGAGLPEESPDIPFLGRGIDNKYIYVESHVRTNAGQRYARWHFDRGTKMRSMPSVPMRMIIFDGRSVAMQLDPDEELAGAVIHHSAQVVRLAKLFFEHCWRHATDVFDDAPAGDAEITPQEAELLHLLVQGATDEQAGRRLGVSLRTVRRMAAKLSEQAGASGRFELGVRAAQRGWVR
jgi:DNA-binding CsgD family transcriptional regulator